MRGALWPGSLIGFGSLFFACAELRRSNHKAARDIPLDESEGDLPPLGSLAVPQQRWSLQKAVHVAEQEPVEDPEAVGSFPDEMTTAVDPTEVEFKVHPQPRVQPADVIRNHPSLIAHKRGQVSQAMSSNASQSSVQPLIVEEFDLVENGIPVGTPTSHGRVVDGEKPTAEDKRREQIGDFDKVIQPKPIGPMPVKTMSHIQQSQTTATEGSRSVTVKKQKPGPEKMKAQCMSFANYLKAQDVQGPELIRMWKGSCDPIVASGNAGPSFSTMCSALGGALEPYVLKQNWPPDKVCDEVLKLFNEAGIGV